MENGESSSTNGSTTTDLPDSEFDSSLFQTAEVTDPFHTYGENDLQCPLCFQYFKGKRLMYQHMNAHSGEKPHRCTECPMSFVRPSCLERHKRTHTGEKPFQCLECHRSFAQLSTYKRHMQSPRLHSTKISRNQSRLHFAISEHKSKGGGVDTEDELSGVEKQTCLELKPFPFHCLLCRMSFEHLSRYKRHMQSRRHRRKEQLTGATSFDTLMSPTRHDDKPEKRNRSAATFNTVMTSGIDAAVEDEMPTIVIAEKPHRCLECNQSFSHQSELEDHIVAHEIERPFQCQICSRRFKIIGALHDHEKTHSGVKRYRCQQCQKSFTRGNGLRRHELTHSDTRVKAYKCQRCQKCFTRRDELRRHGLKHCGDRRFECVECSRKFFQLVQLKRHMQTHVGLKPFACNECRERFPNLYKLELHMTSAHAIGPLLGVIKAEPPEDDSAADIDYDLVHCPASRERKRNCNDRREKFPDSTSPCIFKPYYCVECDRGFSRLENFERHVLTHLQPIFPGLYVCQECGRRFSCATVLMKHTMVKHADC